MIRVECEMWNFKRADDLGQPERVETICRSSGYNVRDPGCNQRDVRGNHWGKVSLGGVRYLGAWVLTVAGMRHGMVAENSGCKRLLERNGIDKISWSRFDHWCMAWWEASGKVGKDLKQGWYSGIRFPARFLLSKILTFPPDVDSLTAAGPLASSPGTRHRSGKRVEGACKLV